MEKSIKLVILLLLIAAQAKGQGYFQWAWPNEGIPDSVHNFLIDDGQEVLEIRQFFVYNKDRVVLVDSSLRYSGVQMDWVGLSKTETVLDPDSKIIAKREYWGDNKKWMQYSIDSVSQDLTNPNLYYITQYDVDDFGNPTVPFGYQLYYLDQLGRDSLRIFYNAQWEEESILDIRQGLNYTSIVQFNLVEGNWKLIEIDSVAFFPTFYTYTYDILNENDVLENLFLDTIFLDEKGRLDYSHQYANTGSSYEYVYKHKFYNSDPVSLDEMPSGQIEKCSIFVQNNEVIIDDANGGYVRLYSTDGKLIDYGEVYNGSFQLHQQCLNGMAILHYRSKIGQECSQKIYLSR